MTGLRTRLGPIAALAALTVAGVALAMVPATAQSPPEPPPNGNYLFHTYCASCHGTSARGDGPLADSLRKRPANLTEIARRNNDVFPRDMVHRIIDGRQMVKGHGGPDMPVWGDIFTRAVGVQTEAAVTARIEALVLYLEGLQARTAN